MSQRDAKIDTGSNSSEQDENAGKGVRSLRARKQVNYSESIDSEELTGKGRKQPKRNLNETYVVPPKEKKLTVESKKKTKTDETDGEENEDEEPRGGKKLTKEKKSTAKSKRAAKTDEVDGEENEDDEPIEKKSKGKGGKSVEKKPHDKKLLNKIDTDYSSINFSSDSVSASGDEWNLKISSWNVDGLRAWLKKDGLKYIEYEDPHILCLQEIKCSEDKLPPEVKVKGYHCYWSSAEKEGYAGVALFSKEEPIKVSYGIGEEEHDNEGRVITAEYDKFHLVTTYVPNAGRGLVTLPKRMSWDIAFRNYVKDLDSKKPVILCGDMNVSHKEIDLANPKTNVKNAGFTKEEREGMTELLAEGFVDTYRHLYPETTGAYTFWTYMGGARSRNVGWRLDYFIVSERILQHVCDNVIRHQVLGSDHCPITLFFHNE